MSGTVAVFITTTLSLLTNMSALAPIILCEIKVTGFTITEVANEH